MADYANGEFPESTYYFSAEFEPSDLCKWIFFFIMVWIAASVLMLIVDTETADEEDCDEGLPKGFNGEADGYKAAYDIEDRGCQSPHIIVSGYSFDEEKVLDRLGM